MALSQLKSVQFDHYIPFATSADGTVNFGSSDIVTTGGIVAAGGNIGDVSFSSCGDISAAGSITAYCGISTCGYISADGFSTTCDGSIDTAGNITLSGGISAIGDIDTCGNISAYGFSVSCGGSINASGSIMAAGGFMSNGFSVQNGSESVTNISCVSASTSNLLVNSAIDCYSGVVRLSGHELFLSGNCVYYRD